MKPKLMGILNVTPDSFYDGNSFYAFEKAVNRGLEMAHEGADIIDIGGESTRPNATPVSLEEELARVIPVIKALRNQIAVPISIDTMKPEVAEKAIQAGASFINDVSGFRLKEMIALAKKTGVQICLMHMRETPLTMQETPFYEEGIMTHLLSWFEKQITQLLKAGLLPEQIVLDPGIGFGKTVADNLKILHNLPKFKALGFPLLIGMSRKSFLAKICQKPNSHLLSATLAANTVAMLSGASYIRVHDVREHRDAIVVLDSLHNLGEP